MTGWKGEGYSRVSCTGNELGSHPVCLASSPLNLLPSVLVNITLATDTAATLYTEYIDNGYDQRLVDERVYKFLRRERDTLTIKPTAIKYR